ncbi:MAG: WXG100 family type VII secretion target [Actinomycetota bacterium]|nr:WXG100 family type VII secretion target [Actinomycetota bacterium]
MAEGAFKYDFGGIAAAQADITSAASRLNGTHEEVNSFMNRLRQTWTQGTAATAWQGYQAEWNKIFADVNAALNSLGLCVDQALQNAQSAEQANTSMWP